ncbi:MAG: hypothetical protein K5683_01430 [Prevotella sp.]|nr:hypothetical protein [Prevotella sp.]
MTKIKRQLRVLMAALAVLVMTASCMDDKEAYNAGFYFSKPAYVVNAVFANNLTDSIAFVSYGNWRVATDNLGGGWCTIPVTTGKGNTFYSFPVTFQQNTSGAGRSTQITFSDTDHPGEASSTLVYFQYATRGDGTLGSAPDVKNITGSDGSTFEFSYDVQHRPLSLLITRDAQVLHKLTLAYNDRDSIMTVTDRTKSMTSQYAKDYQPLRLVGGGDTLGYYAQYYSNGMPASANNAFNIEHHTINGNNTYYAFLLSGQSLMPDSLHNADSLRIATRNGQDYQVAKYKLSYSNVDNRCQSVDANQLVFGTEQCDPYQLLSLFRYARHSSVLSSLVSDTQATISVTTTLNADRSISSLTTQHNGETITYTFQY